jgi:hypothetical protein
MVPNPSCSWLSQQLNMVAAGEKVITFRNLHGVLSAIIIPQACEYIYFETMSLSGTILLTSSVCQKNLVESRSDNNVGLLGVQVRSHPCLNMSS